MQFVHYKREVGNDISWIYGTDVGKYAQLMWQSRWNRNSPSVTEQKE